MNMPYNVQRTKGKQDKEDKEERRRHYCSAAFDGFFASASISCLSESSSVAESEGTLEAYFFRSFKSLVGDVGVGLCGLRSNLMCMMKRSARLNE